MSPCCGESEGPKTGSVTAVIQARLNSTRLYHKALELIGDKPMLAHVVERAKQIKGVSDVIVAVPDTGCQVAFEALNLGVTVVAPQYGVSENDVLGRFRAIADRYQSIDVFMRLTGDSPRLDPVSAAKVLARFQEGNLDYVSNLDDGGEPDCEVFSREALLEADEKASTAYDREHVTNWIRQNKKVDVIVPPKGSKPAKVSIDTKDELETARLRG